MPARISRAEARRLKATLPDGSEVKPKSKISPKKAAELGAKKSDGSLFQIPKTVEELIDSALSVLSKLIGGVADKVTALGDALMSKQDESMLSMKKQFEAARKKNNEIVREMRRIAESTPYDEAIAELSAQNASLIEMNTQQSKMIEILLNKPEVTDYSLEVTSRDSEKLIHTVNIQANQGQLH